jgi:urease accessory protein
LNPRAAPTRISTATAMTHKTHALLRSSHRKRGPRLDSRVRENERMESGSELTQLAELSLEPAALFRLMTWLSPAYPVGAFSYSSGIEWAVDAGDIVDAGTLRQWLNSMLAVGSGLNDGIFFTQSHRAVTRGDDAALVEIAELAAALVPTRERHLETTTLGRAFVEVTRAAWPCSALMKLQEHCSGAIVYPVAVGVACAGHAIPLALALHAFLIAVSANWVSAAMRLIPLGHSDSQRVLSALEPTIRAAAQRALVAELDDLGSATFRADLASARHETQYTRLFRS